jgi:Fic family protein
MRSVRKFPAAEDDLFEIGLYIAQDSPANAERFIDALEQECHKLALSPFDLAVSLRLLCEIHAELLRGARGSERTPGEFRRSQNWIGPPGCTLADARFVPPPPGDVMAVMGDLERFIHDQSPLPILVRAALVHAQFETIHPFLDGNRRVGRLLITFLLCAQGVLRRPMLYLSYDFKRQRQEYYDRLQAVREQGNVEGWVRFFLEGVSDVAREGTDTARRIQRLREGHRNLVTTRLKNSTAGVQLLDRLFERPMVTIQLVQDLLRRSYPAANELVASFVRLGLLREITGGGPAQRGTSVSRSRVAASTAGRLKGRVRYAPRLQSSV